MWTGGEAEKGAIKLRLYVSADRAGSWIHKGDYGPDDRWATYRATEDGEYWLAIQAVLKDGKVEPSAVEKLVPELRVRFSKERQIARPELPPEDLRREVTSLRAEVERLRQRLRELEPGAQKK